MADRHQFAAFIAASLKANPGWLPDALSAVSRGMAEALERVNDARTKADRAMLAALILGGDKRVEASARKHMNSIVCEAINPKGASEIEREYLAKLGDQP